MSDKKLALRTAEDIYQELLQPQNQKDITLTPQQALDVWNIFRKSFIDIGLVSGLKQRAFLQAALMSAIDGSFAMSFVESLFKSAYKPNASVKGIITGLVKTALKNYYRSWKKEPPELYKTVISTIAWSHRPYFDMIESGMGDEL
jgi:hypothetical protein